MPLSGEDRRAQRIPVWTNVLDQFIQQAALLFAVVKPTYYGLFGGVCSILDDTKTHSVKVIQYPVAYASCHFSTT